MENSLTNNKDSVKELTIIVNARERKWYREKISYTDLIMLAFGYENKANITYTLTYRRGVEAKPEGILVDGDEIDLVNQMVFTVSQTSRS